LRALKAVFPTQQWNSWSFSRPHNVPSKFSKFSKTQYLLYQQVQKIFPNEIVKLNFAYSDFDRKVARYIEFDVFIPSLSLAIEYNGEHHYFPVSVYSDLSKTVQRDKLKQSICQLNGITLIVIPYWWNRSIESLAYAIREARPDLPMSHTLWKPS